MLYRKLLRDLWRQRGQVIAVTLVTFLGTALFVGCYLSYQDLRDSYRDAQVRTHLADWTLDVTSASDAQAARVASLPGVAAAESQLVLDLPAVVPGGVSPDGSGQSGSAADASVTARLIGIPLGSQPQLNQVVVVSGRYPMADGEVLVERHLADYHGLQAGDAIRVRIPTGSTERSEQLRVVGVAVSAEYLWVARSRQDPMPSPSEFGVVFVPRSTLETIGRDAMAGLPDPTAAEASPQLHALALASKQGVGNRLLYSLQPGADAQAVLAEVRSLLGADAVVTATPRAELVGIQLLQLDVDGFQEFAVAFPFFFLVVGAFIVASLLNRQVDQERPVVGTMLALGLKPRKVLLHYASFGLTIGLVGSVLGALAGILLGGAMTELYAEELYIPFVTTRVDPLIVAVGALIGLAVPVLGAIPPARRAASLAPAEAMRPRVPASLPSLRLRVGLARHLPLSVRLPLRDVSRHPFRALGTALGVASAVMLIVVTAGMVDSMSRGLELSFDRSQRYDLRADFYVPQATDQLRQAAEGVAGVRQTELLLSLPVQVSAAGSAKSYETILQAPPEPSPLFELVNSSGEALSPGKGQAVLSRSVARDLKVGLGDEVRVKALPGGPTTTVTIGALSDSLLGNSIAMRAEDAGTAFGMEGQATTVLATVDPARRAQARSDLEKLAGVAQVTDVKLVRAQIDDLMGLLYLFLGLMLAFGVVLAAAILYNTATLSILERRRELATMRTLGERMGGIARMVTLENGLVAAVGLIVGLPVALAALWAFVRLYTSDLLSMPFWISTRTVGLSLLGVVLVLLVAQTPALREVSRENLAEATKLQE